MNYTDFIIQVETMNGHTIVNVDIVEQGETNAQALDRVYTEYQSDWSGTKWEQTDKSKFKIVQ